MSKSEPIEERALRILRERGPGGAAPTELAEVLLHARGASAKTAGIILDAALGRDSRFQRGDNGNWRLAALTLQPLTTEPGKSPAGLASPDSSTSAGPAAEFTFLEFTLFGPPRHEVPIEVAAARMDGNRRTRERHSLAQWAVSRGAIARLPEGMDAAALRAAPHLARVLDEFAAFAQGSIVVSFDKNPFHARVCRGAGGGAGLRHVSLKALAKRLRLLSGEFSFEECCRALAVVCPDNSDARARVRADVEMFGVLREQLQELRVAAAQAPDFQKQPLQETDFSRYAFDWGYLQTLPETPGIYIMLDANDTPIYVGKAINLRDRVCSYFRRRAQRDAKTEAILERVHNLAFEALGSELEALLREHEEIQRLQPQINKQYAVRERNPARSRPGNVILVLPSAAAGCAELFMISDGAYLTQLRAPRDEPEAAREAVEEIYFAAELTRDETDRRPEGLEIVWSWLELRRDAVNRIIVEDAGGAAEVMRLLTAHLREEPRPARVYHV